MTTPTPPHSDAPEKGSVAHQIDMAVVRETLRQAPSFTLYGDCPDCHKGECTMNCSSASTTPPTDAPPVGVPLTAETVERDWICKCCQTSFQHEQSQHVTDPFGGHAGAPCPCCKACGQFTYLVGYHFGDPCIHCKTPHDDVAVGACSMSTTPTPSAAPAEPAKGGELELALRLAREGADKAGCDGWRAQEKCRQIVKLLAALQAAPADPVAGVGEADVRRLKLAICGGEDVPGAIEAVSVEDCERFIREERLNHCCASSPDPGIVAKLVGALEEARTTLSILRTQVMVEIGRCADPSESRWEGVPDKLKERLTDLDQALASARQSGGVS